MAVTSRSITRRQLLRSAGAGVAGLALTGTVGELLSGALASSRSLAPPRTPSWHSRPDLRIPALTVTRRESGASSDAIFIAPYNAPVGQAGAVIADAAGEPIWEQPLSDRVTTDFRVQRYRGSPVLTWWEGDDRARARRRRIRDRRHLLPPIRRVNAGNGLRGDLHEFLITPHGTALLTSYVVRDADLPPSAAPPRARSRTRSSRRSTSRVASCCSSGTASTTSVSRSPTRRWKRTGTTSTSTPWTSTATATCSSPPATPTRSTRSTRSGEIIWRLGGKRSDFQIGSGASFAWQHDARRQPDGTITVFDNGATPA